MRALAIFAGLVLTCFGCQRSLYDADKATRAYPLHLHQAASIDIQVFRDGSQLELYNATARSFAGFDLWVNQRYVRHVESLPAGESISLPLWEFWDVRGERINAGGIWRVDQPEPVRLVEIQILEDQPLIGLVTIRAERAE